MGDEQNQGDATPDYKALYEKEQQKAQRAFAETTDLKKKLEPWERFGDPESVRGQLEDYELTRREKAGKDPKEMDALISEREKAVRDSVQKDIESYKSRADSAEAKLNELEVVDRVFSSIVSQFNDDTHEDVKAQIRRYAKRDESGNVVFHDDNGAVRYAPGSANKPMDPSSFAEHLAGIRPSWAKPKSTGGTKANGQASPANGKSATFTAEQWGAMSVEQRTAARAQMPRAEAQRLSFMSRK